MLIKLIEDLHAEETQVTIAYHQRDMQVEKLIEFIGHLDAAGNCLVASSDGSLYNIGVGDVLYIESVDRKTFCYTSDHVYELGLKLYEIEEKYRAMDLMRISKSCIVNLKKIRSLKPDFGGRILAVMENGEKLYISRQYAPVLKEKLGIGGRRS